MIEECNKHGGVLHVYVDRASAGNVYVKCPTITTAVAAVNSLHGRWFAGESLVFFFLNLIKILQRFLLITLVLFSAWGELKVVGSKHQETAGNLKSHDFQRTRCGY